MSHPFAVGAAVIAVLLLALACDVPADAPARRSRRKRISPTLITSRGVGKVHLGMTLSAARSQLPGTTLRRDRDAEGRALVDVSKGRRTLLILDAGEPDPDRPVDGKARIEWITVVDPVYATAEGVRPGLRLKDVEKRYGPLVELRMSEIESREYARFARTPRQFWLRVTSSGGTAGLYADPAPTPPARTQKYRPDARLLHIEISARSYD